MLRLLLLSLLFQYVLSDSSIKHYKRLNCRYDADCNDWDVCTHDHCTKMGQCLNNPLKDCSCASIDQYLCVREEQCMSDCRLCGRNVWADPESHTCTGPSPASCKNSGMVFCPSRDGGSCRKSCRQCTRYRFDDGEGSCTDNCGANGKSFCPTNQLCVESCGYECNRYGILDEDRSICVGPSPATCHMAYKQYCPFSETCVETCMNCPKYNFRGANNICLEGIRLADPEPPAPTGNDTGASDDSVPPPTDNTNTDGTATDGTTDGTTDETQPPPNTDGSGGPPNTDGTGPVDGGDFPNCGGVTPYRCYNFFAGDHCSADCQDCGAFTDNDGAECVLPPPTGGDNTDFPGDTVGPVDTDGGDGGLPTTCEGSLLWCPTNMKSPCVSKCSRDCPGLHIDDHQAGFCSSKPEVCEWQGMFYCPRDTTCVIDCLACKDYQLTDARGMCMPGRVAEEPREVSIERPDIIDACKVVGGPPTFHCPLDLDGTDAPDCVQDCCRECVKFSRPGVFPPVAEYPAVDTERNACTRGDTNYDYLNMNANFQNFLQAAAAVGLLEELRCAGTVFAAPGFSFTHLWSTEELADVVPLHIIASRKLTGEDLLDEGRVYNSGYPLDFHKEGNTILIAGPSGETSRILFKDRQTDVGCIHVINNLLKSPDCRESNEFWCPNTESCVADCCTDCYSEERVGAQFARPVGNTITAQCEAGLDTVQALLRKSEIGAAKEEELFRGGNGLDRANCNPGGDKVCQFLLFLQEANMLESVRCHKLVFAPTDAAWEDLPSANIVPFLDLYRIYRDEVLNTHIIDNAGRGDRVTMGTLVNVGQRVAMDNQILNFHAQDSEYWVEAPWSYATRGDDWESARWAQVLDVDFSDTGSCYLVDRVLFPTDYGVCLNYDQCPRNYICQVEEVGTNCHCGAECGVQDACFKTCQPAACDIANGEKFCPEEEKCVTSCCKQCPGSCFKGENNGDIKSLVFHDYQCEAGTTGYAELGLDADCSMTAQLYAAAKNGPNAGRFESILADIHCGTILAPTNAAWATFPGLHAALLNSANIDGLEAFIRTHTLAGQYTINQLYLDCLVDSSTGCRNLQGEVLDVSTGAELAPHSGTRVGTVDDADYLITTSLLTDALWDVNGRRPAIILTEAMATSGSVIKIDSVLSTNTWAMCQINDDCVVGNVCELMFTDGATTPNTMSLCGATATFNGGSLAINNFCASNQFECAYNGFASAGTAGACVDSCCEECHASGNKDDRASGVAADRSCTAADTARTAAANSALEADTTPAGTSIWNSLIAASPESLKDILNCGVTMLVPLNSAFDNLPPGVKGFLEAALDNTADNHAEALALVQTLIRYHTLTMPVLPDVIAPADRSTLLTGNQCDDALQFYCVPAGNCYVEGANLYPQRDCHSQPDAAAAQIFLAPGNADSPVQTADGSMVYYIDQILWMEDTQPCVPGECACGDGASCDVYPGTDCEDEDNCLRICQTQTCRDGRESCPIAGADATCEFCCTGCEGYRVSDGSGTCQPGLNIKDALSEDADCTVTEGAREDLLAVAPVPLTLFPCPADPICDECRDTFFAPTNQAWANVPGAASPTAPLWQLFNARPDLLADVLNLHVVPDQEINNGDLINGATFSTKLGGHTLQVNVGGSVELVVTGPVNNRNQAMSINDQNRDVLAGRLHKVDFVLFPTDFRVCDPSASTSDAWGCPSPADNCLEFEDTVNNPAGGTGVFICKNECSAGDFTCSSAVTGCVSDCCSCTGFIGTAGDSCTDSVTTITSTMAACTGSHATGGAGNDDILEVFNAFLTDKTAASAPLQCGATLFVPVVANNAAIPGLAANKAFLTQNGNEDYLAYWIGGMWAAGPPAATVGGNPVALDGFGTGSVTANSVTLSLNPFTRETADQCGSVPLNEGSAIYWFEGVNQPTDMVLCGDDNDCPDGEECLAFPGKTIPALATTPSLTTCQRTAKAFCSDGSVLCLVETGRWLCQPNCNGCSNVGLSKFHPVWGAVCVSPTPNSCIADDAVLGTGTTSRVGIPAGTSRYCWNTPSCVAEGPSGNSCQNCAGSSPTGAVTTKVARFVAGVPPTEADSVPVEVPSAGYSGLPWCPPTDVLASATNWDPTNTAFWSGAVRQFQCAGGGGTPQTDCGQCGTATQEVLATVQVLFDTHNIAMCQTPDFWLCASLGKNLCIASTTTCVDNCQNECAKQETFQNTCWSCDTWPDEWDATVVPAVRIRYDPPPQIVTCPLISPCQCPLPPEGG